MEKLIELGSITPECASFLEKLVRARYSIVIGGGTGSGKMCIRDRGGTGEILKGSFDFVHINTLFGRF